VARQSKPRRGQTNRLRIIAGRWRGRRLEFPAVEGLRPTPDRLRETLFNWLQGRLHGARCLDLFAGSGALGLEALSRGAGECVFVERDKRAAASLRQHCQRLQATARIHCQDALECLQTPPAQPPFELVFLDPPFHRGLAQPCLQALIGNGWLAAHARIYLETEPGMDALPPGLQVEKEKRAGQVLSRLLTYRP